MHLIRHVIEQMQNLGPVYGTWMYSFECLNSYICQRVLNRYSPETTVLEAYRVSDKKEIYNNVHVGMYM